MQLENGVLRLPDAIDVHNANALRREGDVLIAGAPEGMLRVDLTVVEANSVALAVLMGWLATARQRGLTLQLDGISPAFHAVAEFSGVESLLAEEGNPS